MVTDAELMAAARRLAVDILTPRNEARPTADPGEDGELIARLRYGKGVESWWVLGDEAADRIEQLEKALEHVFRYYDPEDESVARGVINEARAVLSRSGG